jgi:uncharacterized protein
MTPREVPAGTAVVVMAVALALAGVVNGADVRRSALAQPYGPVREVAVVAATPLDVLARSPLGAPRRALESATGREPLASGGRFVLPDLALPAQDRPARAPGSPGPVPGTGDGATAPPEGATTPTTAPQRVPTAEAPLRLLFAGDSLIGNVATGFTRAARDEARIAISVEFQVATGLARPDVLNWPAHLAGVLAQVDPEVVVLMFGGNDDQDLETEHGRASLLSEAWQLEYGRRVGLMMDLAATEGRQVIWLGIPAVRRDRLEAARLAMNDLARSEAGLRLRATYVDLDPVLAPGGYATDVGGTRVREHDGVHITITGGEHLAPTVLDTLRMLGRLP